MRAVDWAWLWLPATLAVLLIATRIREDAAVDWARARRSALWVVQHDFSGAVGSAAVVAALGAALVTWGFIDVKNPTAFWFGMVLILLAVAAVLSMAFVAVRGRYREEGYRHRLASIASLGRGYLRTILGSKGANCPTSQVDQWGQDATALLMEMDPTGVYVERFENAAGLPMGFSSLTGVPQTYEAYLRNRTARLQEILAESRR